MKLILNHNLHLWANSSVWRIAVPKLKTAKIFYKYITEKYKL